MEPILATPFHRIKEIQLNPAALQEVVENAAKLTPERREEVREAFLAAITTDASVLGRALASVGGHLVLPVLFGGFPDSVDKVALQAKLREIHGHLADAAQGMVELCDIATNGLPELGPECK